MDKDEQKERAKDVQLGIWMREMTETQGWKYFLDMVSKKTTMLNDLRQIDHNAAEKKIATQVAAHKLAIKLLLEVMAEVDALVDQGQVSDKELNEDLKK